MKYLMCFAMFFMLIGCSDMKFRTKNVHGDVSQAQIDKDFQDCYQYTRGRSAFNECIQKKGYYSEQYYD